MQLGNGFPPAGPGTVAFNACLSPHRAAAARYRVFIRNSMGPGFDGARPTSISPCSADENNRKLDVRSGQRALDSSPLGPGNLTSSAECRTGTSGRRADEEFLADPNELDCVSADRAKKIRHAFRAPTRGLINEVRRSGSSTVIGPDKTLPERTVPASGGIKMLAAI